MGDQGALSVTSDQLAKLLQMLAPALPGTHLLYEAISAKLCTQVKDITDAGKAALEAAFPGGEGADFRSKARLLKVVAKGENVASRSPSRRGSGKTKKAR